MAKEVDAVIAALKVALAGLETNHSNRADPRICNRWIAQLPGAWYGRWRHLKMRGLLSEDLYVPRNDLIAHVRSVIAYLETQGDQRSGRSWFSRGKAKRAGSKESEPIDAEFQEVPRNVHPLPVPPPNKRNR